MVTVSIKIPRRIFYELFTSIAEPRCTVLRGALLIVHRRYSPMLESFSQAQGIRVLFAEDSTDLSRPGLSRQSFVWPLSSVFSGGEGR